MATVSSGRPAAEVAPAAPAPAAAAAAQAPTTGPGRLGPDFDPWAAFVTLELLVQPLSCLRINKALL
jgi:hypothetical protein